MADVRCQETECGPEKTTVATENMDGGDSESETEDIYEVEKIVDMTKSKGKMMYRVRWAGYGPTWDTWEPHDNLESCHHVIDQYMEDRRIAQEERAAKVEREAKEASLADSDSDSVQSGASRASRKRKSTKANYVYVEDEDCDTLKDKFWRDLEEGKINVFGSDMYSKVKGQGRSSRPTSFSDMFKNQLLEQQEDDDEEDSEEQKCTSKRFKRENSIGGSSSVPSEKSEMAEVMMSSGSCLNTGMHKTKKSRRDSLTKQVSVESESSVFANDSTDTTATDTTTISTGSKRWVRHTSKPQTDAVVVVSEPEMACIDGDGTVERVRCDHGKISDCVSSGESAGSSSGRTELPVKSSEQLVESESHIKSELRVKSDSSVKSELHRKEMHVNDDCLTEKHVNDEHVKDEHVKEKHVMDECMKEKCVKGDGVKEAGVMDDHVKEPHVKVECVKETDLKDECLKEIRVKDRHVKETQLKDERLKETRVKDECVKETQVKDEHLKETHLKDEHMKEMYVKDECMKEAHQKDEHGNETHPKDERMKVTHQKDERVKEMCPKDERMKEIHPKDERIKETHPKDERVKEMRQKDERMKETRQKDEHMKERRQKDERMKEMCPKDERMKELRPKDERMKETRLKDERMKETRLKDERVKETRLKEERVKEMRLKERTGSPVRERAPIMVIRRSADGNGYTQKLVEGRPRTKSFPPDERASTSKSTERRSSPSLRELTTITTEVTSPVSIKITTTPRRPSPDMVMDASSSKLRSSSRTTPTGGLVAPSCVSVEKFKRGYQMAGLSLEHIREEWAKRDPKLASCHVVLYDAKTYRASASRHRQERKNNLNKILMGESCGAVKTSRMVMEGPHHGWSSNIKTTSPLRVSLTTEPSLSGAGTGNMSGTREKLRIPKMKISTSPPTCRRVTGTSTVSASLSSLTTYRIHSSYTSTKSTCIKSESSIPTSTHCQATVPRTSSAQPTVPRSNANARPLGGSTTTPPLPTLKYEAMENFINELGQQGEEEIPGLGDILPLSLRPTLEPSTPITTRTTPNQTTANCVRGPSLGNALPPISTLPGASPPSVQNATHQTSPLAHSALHTQTSPITQCGLLPQSHSQQPYPSGHHNSHPDLSGLSSLLAGGGVGGTDNNTSLLPNHHQQLTDPYPDLSVPPPAAPGVISDNVHRRPPYPVPSPTQYSTSSMLSPFPDPSVLSPAPHIEPMSPLSGYLQPSPSHLSMESPRYMGTTLEESCNQFNDVDMRRVGNVNAHNPVQAQQMNWSAGTPGAVPAAAPSRGGYNPYSPHQGASPYATSTGSPAAWSMSSPSPGTPGGPVSTTQGLGTAGNKLLDDTAFDFDLLEVDPSLWDQKHSSDKNVEQVDVTNLELKNAVRNNDYETVRRALGGRTRYDLEMRDDQGITLLMMAAARSYDDVLELLVLNAANINARSKNGSTTLMFACENGHRCTVELLLIMGAHMNVQTVTGDTALTKAVKNGNKHIVRLLLDHGSNFSSPSYLNDLTAMKVAKQRNQTEITEMLNKHLSWVTADFENQVKITLNNTAGILCALFPMQCFALSESDHITITFNHELQPTLPGVGVLLFIAHARITSSEVRCRFYGPCAVNGATLNGYQLHPLTEEANFVMSFSPLYNGRNDLEIKTVKAPTSRAKLVVCAYNAQLALPPD